MSSYIIDEIGSKRVISLGRKLGEGAAGVVFSLPTLPGRAAKIYKSRSEAAEYEEKVSVMLISRPNLPDIRIGGVECRQIAWPQARLLDHSGRFSGFVMPEIDFDQSRPLESVLQRNSRRADNIEERYELRIILAANLAAVFAELHRVGHYMIDMKPDNLRFYPGHGYLAVVDTDGFSIKGETKRLPSQQFTPNYIAPEGRNRSPAGMGVDQDLFALAVITFQLINNGVHPYTGIVSSSAGLPSEIQARIYANLYAYGIKVHKAIKPSPASIHTCFDDGTRALFDRAFLGIGGRPTAREWREHLQALLRQKKLMSCRVNPKDHVHFGKGCGLCDYEHRIKLSGKTSRKRQAASVASIPIAVPFTFPSQPSAIPPSPPPPLSINPTANPPIPPLKIVGWGVGGLIALLILLDLVSGPGSVRPIPPVPAPTNPGYSVQYFQSPQGYVTASSPGVLRINVRSGPGEGYSQVAQLAVGDRVTGNGSASGSDGMLWIAVTLPGGASGFIAERLLRPEAPLPQISEQPSFSCAGTLTYVESTICNDAGLAAKDREVAALYARVLSSPTASGARDTQRGWREERDRCGGSGDIPACLHSAYDSRLAALRDWAAAPAPIDDTIRMAPSSPSTPNPSESQRSSGRQSGGRSRQDQGPPTAMVTCILSNGQEIRLSPEQCRQSSGVIYSNEEN